MSGRLALFRWVLRIVRAERRQHALVIAMIAFGIAIATLLISSTVRFGEPEERSFADANVFAMVSGYGEDPAVYADLESGVTAVLADHPDIRDREHAEHRVGEQGREQQHRSAVQHVTGAGPRAHSRPDGWTPGPPSTGRPSPAPP